MSLILTPDELVEITGYQLAAYQLKELHRRGFFRARRSRVTGDIILERAHYDAVCAGPRTTGGPKIRQPQLRTA